MSEITIQLFSDTEQRLRTRARESGQTIEGYVERVVEQAIAGESPATVPATPQVFPRFISEPTPSDAEFAHLMMELASPPTGKVLPPDFSRADIYDDHD